MQLLLTILVVNGCCSHSLCGAVADVDEAKDRLHAGEICRSILTNQYSEEKRRDTTKEREREREREREKR